MCTGKQKRPASGEWVAAVLAESSDDDEPYDELYHNQAVKRARLALEDPVALFRRLRNEGATLAAEERFSGAIAKFDEALSLAATIPAPPTILALTLDHLTGNYSCQPVGDRQAEMCFQVASAYEMKAQALLAVGEFFPAVQAAEAAVALCPTWDEGRQTLGRAQLNYGEIRMGLVSVAHTLHLNPMNETAFSDDMPWAMDLWTKEKERLRLEGEGVCVCVGGCARAGGDGGVYTCASRLHGRREPDMETLEPTEEQLREWDL
eukprot:comp14481_c0_seq1/m.10642 comp14481_c0_seq1/g.10642  ORF comp14481_c0_seq1/g.10642 comp14481_c0_seq1/m.10642 type:complete len:263 (-) comp14481_c0_seq1:187-975(-)